MASPIPQPTALRIARGNPGKRKIKHEPKPHLGVGECPSWLDDLAKTEWFSKVAELEHMGVLTQADDTALAAYCREWSKYLFAEKQLMENGMTMKAPTGYEMPSPWVAISSKAFEHANKLRAEFGLTPAARVRLGTVKEKPKVDPFEAWQKGAEKA